ncbi:MAG TPA: hypothetical protein VFQ54_02620, partial [Thermomicrobiales bacterium]|nr:hypothetical protein [Thermomicrobiales bacterium]
REDEEHSETLAIFWALLISVGIIAESTAHPSWSTISRTRDIPDWWFGFFSYVDSGPPAERLELILALQRAGLVTFVGGDSRFEIDDDQGVFVAATGQHPETVTARFMIDGFHPPRAVENSAEPVLRDIITTHQGYELVLGDREHPVPTGRLAVDEATAQVLLPDGTPHPRRYAVGDFTSAPAAGTFARPGTNARIFRANDSIARSLLETIARASALHPALPMPESTRS